MFRTNKHRTPMKEPKSECSYLLKKCVVRVLLCQLHICINCKIGGILSWSDLEHVIKVAELTLDCCELHLKTLRKTLYYGAWNEVKFWHCFAILTLIRPWSVTIFIKLWHHCTQVEFVCNKTSHSFPDWFISVLRLNDFKAVSIHVKDTTFLSIFSWKNNDQFHITCTFIFILNFL